MTKQEAAVSAASYVCDGYIGHTSDLFGRPSLVNSPFPRGANPKKVDGNLIVVRQLHLTNLQSASVLERLLRL